MREVISRLSSLLRPASRRELEQTKQQLEQARQQNHKLQRQLDRTKQQLEQARQQNQKVRQRLRRTKRQPKQSTREGLLRRMPKRSVCAEIGVDRGDFSESILEVVEPDRLHLIDPWEHQEEDKYQESRYGGLGPEGQVIMDQRYHEVKERFDEELRARRVQIHRSYSDVAAPQFEDSYFDWIYIDGNHLYEFVKRDLELYYPKVKANGYIAGDDYGAQNNWWENGVQKAVDEFVAQRPELALEISGRQFLIKKGARTSTAQIDPEHT